MKKYCHTYKHMKIYTKYKRLEKNNNNKIRNVIT